MSDIIFDTKENNNLRRQEAFLKLTPAQRVQVFLKMIGAFTKFGIKQKPQDKGNFVLTIPEDGV